jgi:hypothetical protein
MKECCKRAGYVDFSQANRRDAQIHPRRRRAPVLVGSYSPHERKDDAWLIGVKAMARAANKSGRKVRLRYVLGPVRRKYRWKYQAHKQKVRAEDVEQIFVYVQ